MQIKRCLVMLITFQFICSVNISNSQTFYHKSSPEIFLQMGHSRVVFSMCFHPDGSYFISGSGDNTIKLWEVDSGRLIRTFYGHMAPVLSVDFSPDGKQIVSGSADHTIKLWDVKNGKLLRTFSGHSDSVWSVDFSDNGSFIVSGSSDSSIILWKIRNGERIKTIEKHAEPVYSVKFIDNDNVLSGSADKKLLISEHQSWKLSLSFETQRVQSFIGHDNTISSADISPDNLHIISGSWDKTLKLWNIVSGKLIRTFKGHTAPVFSVHFSPDGKQIISGSADSTIKKWDVKSGKLLKTYRGHKDPIWSVCFSPDSSSFISGGGEVSDTNESDNTIKLWDSDSGKLIKNFSGHSLFATCTDFSPDATQIISGNTNNDIELRTIDTGKLIQTFEGHSNRINAIAFNPNNPTIISGSDDDTVKLWDINTGKTIRTYYGHSENIKSVRFHPNGELFISGSDDDSIKLWNVYSNKPKISLDGHSDSVNTVAFSPDGALIVSGSDDKSIKLWDANSGKLIQTIDGHSDNVYAVNFSSRSDFIVSGSADKSIKLWDTKFGKLIRTLEGHTEYVYSVNFSPDDAYIISGSGDHSIKIWHTNSGRIVNTIDRHSSNVYSASFSSDGKHIISSSRDHTIRLWDNNGTQLMIIALLPEKQWLAWSPDTLNYHSSIYGDEYAFVRFENNTWNYSPLINYRKKNQEKLTLSQKTSSLSDNIYVYCDRVGKYVFKARVYKDEWKPLRQDHWVNGKILRFIFSEKGGPAKFKSGGYYNRGYFRKTVSDCRQLGTISYFEKKQSGHNRLNVEVIGLNRPLQDLILEKIINIPYGATECDCYKRLEKEDFKINDKSPNRIEYNPSENLIKLYYTSEIMYSDEPTQEPLIEPYISNRPEQSDSYYTKDYEHQIKNKDKYYQINLITYIQGDKKIAIDEDEDIEVIAHCQKRKTTLKFDGTKDCFTGILKCPQEELTINVSSVFFEPASLVPDNHDVTYEMKHTKPVLYVLINPENKMNVSEFKHDPNRFNSFKINFYKQCKILDSTQEPDWGKKWLRTYFYVQNLNSKKALYPKDDMNSFINLISFGYQSIEYESLIRSSIEFFNGFSFSSKSLKGVAVIIGALTVININEIEKQLQKNNVAALIVQLGETGKKMQTIKFSNYLTVLRMDIQNEFTDIKLNQKDNQAIFFKKTFEKINTALKKLMSKHGFKFRYMN